MPPKKKAADGQPPVVTGPVEGRDELNLVEIPFALTTRENRRPGGAVERNWTEGDREYYYIIAPNVEAGMPTFAAEEVYIAAQELTFRQEPPNRQVFTTKADLLEIIGWADTGHYRQLVETCFSQLQGTVIRTNHFWDHRQRAFMPAHRAAFTIIQAYQFFTEEGRRGRRGPQLGLPLSWFMWNEVVWDSLQAGFIKRLNTRVYFSLRSDMARRLYRLVDKWTHDPSNPHREIDLVKVATVNLGMSTRYDHPSKLARKLADAIEELNGRGVARIRIERAHTTASGYKMVVDPLPAVKALPAPAQAPAASAAAQALVDALVTRGINPRVAERLVAQKAAHIARQLEVFDYLRTQPHREPLSPGYLHDMILEGWWARRNPKGFRPKAELREELEQQEALRQGLLSEYGEAAAHIRQEVDAWAQLAPAQRIHHPDLDQWEIDFRQGHGRNPSAKEKAARVQRMVARLRSPAAELGCRIEALQKELNQRAAQAGLGPLPFPDEGAPQRRVISPSCIVTKV